MDIKLSDIQAAGTVQPAKADQNQYSTDALGNDGCQRNSRHIHVQGDDEKQVQDDIDDPGHRQEVQGSFGVPGGPQDGASEVVDHVSGHADEDDLQIDGGFVQHIFRRAHFNQQRFREEKANQDQGKPGRDADGDGRVYVVPGSLFVRASQRMPYDDVGADGQADKKIHQKIGQRAGGAHRCQGFLAGKTSHHDHVRGVEQKLQAAGQY